MGIPQDSPISRLLILIYTSLWYNRIKKADVQAIDFGDNIAIYTDLQDGDKRNTGKLKGVLHIMTQECHPELDNVGWNLWASTSPSAVDQIRKSQEGLVCQKDGLGRR